jgi:hypothetical protein
VTAPTPEVERYEVLLDNKLGRLEAPANVHVEVNAEGHPAIGQVVIDVELVGRRYEIKKFIATPPRGGGLRLLDLRSLPLERWLRAGIEHRMRMVTPDGTVYTAEDPMPAPDPMWQTVDQYSIAVALGENPVMAVAEHFGIESGAAAQRVKRARAKGYLPPTTPGRAS